MSYVTLHTGVVAVFGGFATPKHTIFWDLDGICEKGTSWKDRLDKFFFFLIFCDENYVMVGNKRLQVSP